MLLPYRISCSTLGQRHKEYTWRPSVYSQKPTVPILIREEAALEHRRRRAVASSQPERLGYQPKAGTRPAAITRVEWLEILYSCLAPDARFIFSYMR